MNYSSGGRKWAAAAAEAENFRSTLSHAHERRKKSLPFSGVFFSPSVFCFQSTLELTSVIKIFLLNICKRLFFYTKSADCFYQFQTLTTSILLMMDESLSSRTCRQSGKLIASAHKHTRIHSHTQSCNDYCAYTFKGRIWEQ